MSFLLHIAISKRLNNPGAHGLMSHLSRLDWTFAPKLHHCTPFKHGIRRQHENALRYDRIFHQFIPPSLQPSIHLKCALPLIIYRHARGR